MSRELSSIRQIAYAFLLFAIVGISLATETMARFGLEQNYVYIASAAFLFVALLLGRKPMFVLVVVIGVVVVNLPAVTLMRYGIDRDMLLAFVCAIILAPTIYNLITK